MESPEASPAPSSALHAAPAPYAAPAPPPPLLAEPGGLVGFGAPPTSAPRSLASSLALFTTVAVSVGMGSLAHAATIPLARATGLFDSPPSRAVPALSRVLQTAPLDDDEPRADAAPLGRLAKATRPSASPEPARASGTAKSRAPLRASESVGSEVLDHLEPGGELLILKEVGGSLLVVQTSESGVRMGWVASTEVAR
jgi:hypothetical protein